MSIGFIKKQFIVIPLLLLFIGFFFTSKANAASLSNASDTLSTSRPSAAAPLSADQTSANVGQVSVVDNGSIYLASDTAVLQTDTGQAQNIMTVASMSAQQAGPIRYVYFTSTTANQHHKGTALVTNIPATHIIEFTPNTIIPNGGHINLVFPTVANNTASPSATGFSFNGLTSGTAGSYIICNPTTACAGSFTVTGNTIQLTTTASLSNSSPIYIAVGCSGTITVTGGQATCTTSKPLLINPVKSINNTCSNLGVGVACTADQWKMTIQTTDASSIVLDSSKIVAGTIESVQVQGTVEPYLTFTITGLDNGTSVCSGFDTTNPGTGNGATPYFVNLGGLSNAINISAQNLIVSTNGSFGYDITATSSGHFTNAASGFWFPDANTGNGLTGIDTPAPAAITAGTTAFGIHPCPAGATSIPTVNTTTWGTGGATGGANAKYSNPWNTGVNNYFANISSFSSPASNSTTTIEYAATAALTVPAGIYTTVLTYVATPSF